MQRIDDLFDQLVGSCVFNSSELAQGYYQIHISEEDVPKSTNRYLLVIINSKFWLTNAPATFQAVMNKEIQQQLGMFILVYLDDILFSKIQKKILNIYAEYSIYHARTNYMPSWPSVTLQRVS